MLCSLEHSGIAFHKVPSREESTLQSHAVEHWYRVGIGETTVHNRYPNACASVACKVHHREAKQLVLLARIAPERDVVA